MKRILSSVAALATMIGTLFAPIVARAATKDPSISVYGFSDNTTVSNRLLAVRVPDRRNEYVHLWLDGTYQHGTYHKGWEDYNLKLKTGKNVVSAQVVGQHNGLKSRMEHKVVTYVETAPLVSIYGVSNKQPVLFSALTVHVPHDAAQTVHLWLNGKYQSGNGNYTLNLKNGTNVISAQVVDRNDDLKSRVEHKIVTYSSKLSQNAMKKAVEDYLKTRHDQVGIAVYNQKYGTMFSLNGETPFKTASTIKASILVDLLHKNLMTKANQETVTTMIENSNNTSASDLWNQIGGAKAMDMQFGNLKMKHSIAGEHGMWGLTQTTADDQIQVLKTIADPNSYLSSSKRKYALNLMEHIERGQDWGVSTGVRDATVALKNGWSPYVYVNWRVNSIGYIHGNGRNYLISIYTFHNATMQYGVKTIDGLSRIVWHYDG